MSRFALVLPALLAAQLVAAPTARAYTYRGTHPWLTRQAAALLVAAYPGRYDEVLQYIDETAEGSAEEDDFFLDGDTDPTTMRVMRHFFRPTDFAGLTMTDGRTYPNSYEWGVEPNEGNEWGWDDGMRAYQTGDHERAYRTLGHVVHLVQDLTVPAHTHLDIHGPPAGDDYEKYCSEHSPDEFTADLALPAPGTPFPEYTTPWEVWYATARASYWRNMYPGDLSDTSAATGVVADMFPGLSWSWFSKKWSIGDPPVGDLGTGFLETDPGVYYFKKTAYPAAMDYVGFDAGDPDRLEGFGANESGEPMAALMADDLIPLAVLNSAALMKIYLDQAYALPPQTPPDEPPDVPAVDDGEGGCSVGGRMPGAPAAIGFAALAWLLARRRK